MDDFATLYLLIAQGDHEVAWDLCEQNGWCMPEDDLIQQPSSFPMVWEIPWKTFSGDSLESTSTCGTGDRYYGSYTAGLDRTSTTADSFTSSDEDGRTWSRCRYIKVT